MSYKDAAEAFQKAESRAQVLFSTEDTLTLALLFRSLLSAHDWRPATIETELRVMRKELEKKK